MLQARRFLIMYVQYSVHENRDDILKYRNGTQRSAWKAHSCGTDVVLDFL